MRHRLVRRLTLAAVILAALGAFAVNVAVAQGPPASAPSDSALEARTSEIAARLRCPVCQGESIQDSPAELAQQMRAVVKQQLSEGRSREEIEAYFVARYGEWILLEPTMTGLNKALYAFPVVLMLGGLALIVVLVKRWTSAPADASVEEPSADADSLAGRV